MRSIFHWISCFHLLSLPEKVVTIKMSGSVAKCDTKRRLNLK